MDENPESPIEATNDTNALRANRGVDESLIEWMLSLSPAERVAVAEDWANMVGAFDTPEVDDAD